MLRGPTGAADTVRTTTAAVTKRPALRRLAGLAGLGYVAGVSIENMEILEAPTLASPVADIRALYENEALLAVTTIAGAVALVFYVVFAVSLVRLLREPGRRGEGWSTVALVGGVGGPLVATAGLIASAVLILDGSLSDDEMTDLFDFYVRARMVSGVFVAMFLGGIGVGVLRSRVAPIWIGWYAAVLAIPMILVPFAALGEDESLAVAVGIAFAFQTLWIFLVSLWLLLANGVGPLTFVRRSAFLLLVMAAGLIGVALVAVPGATGEFFAWDLAPEPLAAFAGGVYVGSAAAYAVALPRDDREVRGLVLGAVVLSVSVFVITLAHLDLFDFARLQAWAWVALFAGFSVVTAGVFLLGAAEPMAQPAVRPLPWVRVVLGAVAVLLGGLALGLWIDPTALTDDSPFELPPLGGRFAGSWVALLAVLAGWAALRNRADEAALSAIAIVALSAGALIAALRTLADLEPAGGYIAALVLLLGMGAVVLRATSWHPRRNGARTRPSAS
jgi:hypothetical protein